MASDRSPVQQVKIETKDGIVLHCRTVGSGAQKVVIPAATSIGTELDSLSDGRELIFYDMRNRGLSSTVDMNQISIQHDIHDLEAVRDHFKAETISLIGWSVCGLLVAAYAFEHPENIERVIQICPGPPRYMVPDLSPIMDAEPPVLDKTKYMSILERFQRGEDLQNPVAFNKEYWEFFLPILIADASKISLFKIPAADIKNELVSYMFRTNAQIANSLGADYDYRHRAANFTSPVLTIHGDKDYSSTYSINKEWAISFANGRLLTVEGAAHMPFIEQSELVISAMDCFLKGAWPESAKVVRATV